MGLMCCRNTENNIISQNEHNIINYNFLNSKQMTIKHMINSNNKVECYTTFNHNQINYIAFPSIDSNFENNDYDEKVFIYNLDNGKFVTKLYENDINKYQEFLRSNKRISILKSFRENNTKNTKKTYSNNSNNNSDKNQSSDNDKVILISYHEDKEFKLWSFVTNDLNLEIQTNLVLKFRLSNIYLVGFDICNGLIITFGGDMINIIDPYNPDIIISNIVDKSKTFNLLCSIIFNDILFLISSHYNNIMIWDPFQTDKQLIYSIDTGSENITCLLPIEFNNELIIALGSKVFIGQSDNIKICFPFVKRLSNKKTSFKIKTIGRHIDGVVCMSYIILAAKQIILVTGGYDSQINIWDPFAKIKNSLFTLAVNCRINFIFAYTLDDLFFIVNGTEDKKVMVWGEN